MDGSKPFPAFDEDYLLWAKAQAAAIRARDWDAVDLERVAEEIESLGGSERREMENRLIRLIEHRLKLDHGLNREPQRQWSLSVRTQQRGLTRLFRKMPSLRSELEETIAAIYGDAREAAMDSFKTYEPDRADDYETALPRECPYASADLLDPQP